MECDAVQRSGRIRNQSMRRALRARLRLLFRRRRRQFHPPSHLARARRARSADRVAAAALDCSRAVSTRTTTPRLMRTATTGVAISICGF